MLYGEGKWAEALATGKEALTWVEHHDGADSLLAASCVGDIADV